VTGYRAGYLPGAEDTLLLPLPLLLLLLLLLLLEMATGRVLLESSESR